jgi:Major Facilitator Superfamily.
MAMAYPAVLSVVQEEWGLSSTAAGSISSAYQIGTAVALVFVSALADYLDPRLLFRVSAGVTAAVSLLIPVLAHGHLSALLLFGAVAVAVSGIYTPGHHAARGALRAGAARPGHGLVSRRLVDGLRARARGRRGGGGARGLAAGPLRARPGAPPVLALSFALFSGERSRRAGAPAPRRVSFDADLAGNRPAQLMIWGYVFHSWELLGMWAWTPAFIAAALAVQGTTIERAAGWAPRCRRSSTSWASWPRPQAGHCQTAGGAPRSSGG